MVVHPAAGHAAQAAELGGKRGAVRRAQDMADIFSFRCFCNRLSPTTIP